MANQIDLVDRDPKHLNEDVVKIDFVDLIAEPEGIHSLGICWSFSSMIFSCTKISFYCFFTTILGIPLAFFWGVFFAVFSFIHIWFVVPCVRCCLICIQFDARVFSIWLRLFTVPFYEAVSKIFSNIRASVQKEV